MYSKSDILNWIHSSFIVNSHRGDEVNFNCPVCDHPRFYFNLSKKVGFCHRGNCHETPTLDDLITIVGFPPDSTGFVPKIPEKSKQKKIVSLPKNCFPVVEKDKSGFFTRFEEPFNYLRSRHLSTLDIYNWNIHFDGRRVIVPVYESGNLVQFVSRTLRNETPKYRYASGVNIQEYFFGWDECKHWDRLTLVENTFVSIALRNLCFCSTNFGSNMSKIQLKKIKNSSIRSVVLAWDSDALGRSSKFASRLREMGVAACSYRVEGQPEDHQMIWLVDRIFQTHRAAKNGEHFFGP